jgi:hypothetical protein
MKKPIIQIDEFLSPLRCKSSNVLDYTDQKIIQVIPYIEEYYNVKIIDHTKASLFTDLKTKSDNSILRGNWVKVKNIDFTCYIPLFTFNNKPPFDPETDVYGGGFHFNFFNYTIAPTMGRLLVFPSAPNFTHTHEPIKIGSFNYMKIFLTCDKPYVYDLTKWNNKL